MAIRLMTEKSSVFLLTVSSEVMVGFSTYVNDGEKLREKFEEKLLNSKTNNPGICKNSRIST